MSKPLIGISLATAQDVKTNTPFRKFVINRDYVERVTNAGGVPILVPPGADSQTIAPLLDGWIIPGGDDLDPALWGADLHEEADLEFAERTRTETDLYRAVNPSMPILGICYGCQLINVLHGGTLHQHIPDQIGHDQHRGDTMQSYDVEPKSRLGGIVGQTATGKSSHHQAVDGLGNGLRVVAKHEDGTIEAIESTDQDRWVIAVQWHPERSDTAASDKLFTAFMDKARQFKEAKTSCDTW